MVEDKTLLVTPVKIEFNIPWETTEHNGREEIIQLTHKMRKQDQCLRLKFSLPNGRKWRELDQIPENHEFLEQLQRNYSKKLSNSILMYSISSLSITITYYMPIVTRRGTIGECSCKVGPYRRCISRCISATNAVIMVLAVHRQSNNLIGSN